MTLLVLNQQEVEELLDMEGCIGAMEDALASLARGELHLPLRMIVRPAERDDLFGLMPSHRGGERPLYGLKTVAIFPDNPSRGLDPHQGTVTLYDGETGETLAVLNASAITAIRTAACSAVATKLLARKDARVVAMIGAGHQAKAHLEAMRAVGDFDEIRIVSRNPDHAERLAAQAPNARAVRSAEEALGGADVVVTVTNSPEPVLRREWLAPGTHVNAVGSGFPHTRELDTATVADSAFFVDRRESAENEAGDYLIPLREGAIGPDHIRAELGEVLVGAKPGRTSDDELTVFESLGLAVEDLFAAEYAVRRARESGRGTELEF
jgi:ornithine cyclodeaminase/alanine dehydrogenase-like protein (mu-crystallin family)